ncbi:SAM-dependent methyltransferase [Shewanella sp. 10N.286.52.C2]|uniref:RsmB/NOP family class I SAM-dependent RNA methyltransferase n=1 Tax=Shewanella sp. 10N.286.52.C2 TaxID=1880838 RepID=UPI000C8556C9|nr:RsmB/NOP family class I SAM-dependent RNA methyltransferase [Shewanella sp. 10N.286.52.C2]PMG31141.1 SAM-dependent methyltransferase [Shewanella sp. 10N.286.52.C2]
MEPVNQPHLQANTPAEKRALSYSATIKKLFDEVLDTKMPADRIVANYFREHKKHGSKDRRVIRETLFGLFRWWGWLKQLGSQHEQQTWYQMLSTCALLEQHQWRQFADAWQQFGGLSPEQVSLINHTIDANDVANSSNPQSSANFDVSHKNSLMGQLFTTIEFAETQLLPDWFWALCTIDDQQNKLKLIEAMSSRPPIWARAQRIDTASAVSTLQAAGIDAQASEYFADALSLGSKSINLNDVDLYKQGKLEIQDLASQVIGNVCQPLANEQWWDTCSGAGGKTLQLRSLMLQNAASNNNTAGTITSSDIRSKALEELNKRAKRANFDSITVARWKSDALPVAKAHFDGVLVDAPCSCTGTWRRNPDMRWIDEPSCIEDKPALQLDILTRSSKAVKPGGKLVYATCSLSPLENEQVVQQFLQHNSDFELITSVHPFTQAKLEHITVWPFEANSDGMYVARMMRK